MRRFPGKHWSKLKDEHERRIKPHIHPNLDQESVWLYIFRAYLWPGERVMFDGSPVEYTEAPKMLDWAFDEEASPYDDVKEEKGAAFVAK